MSSGTYLSRKAKLLKGFDRSISRVENILIARYGEHEASALVHESREHYAALIPHIPYIGEHNPLLNFFLLPASRYLGIYRAFQARRRTLEEVGRLVYEMSSAEIQALPHLVRRGIGALWFSDWFKERLQKRAALSQQRKYPGDYVIAFVDGDGQDFDYGIDYLQCAACDFYRAQGAAELAPYLCAIDHPASELLGWGLRRTTTLSGGDQRCDFRFKKGGETRVNLPPSLLTLFGT
jgi:hypothetical protein